MNFERRWVWSGVQMGGLEGGIFVGGVGREEWQ